MAIQFFYAVIFFFGLAISDRRCQHVCLQLCVVTVGVGMSVYSYVCLQLCVVRALVRARLNGYQKYKIYLGSFGVCGGRKVAGLIPSEVIRIFH
jgi:hypothetical protein